ncbi:MAG: protein kinase [Candidatus Sumerlaeia bacterium]|nr:protein kinase [Candidatus Sumerlaeia bacterium]
MASTPQFRTLLLTDLVGSTALVERLGDARSGELFARTDRAARDLLAAHNGREIDRTDGFLLLFERPIDAVRFALAHHAALAALGVEAGEPLAARTGIHFAEVVLRENPPADIARGAKPLEVEGLAKPLAARVMSLAEPRQTLLTRAAFDLARRASVGTDAVPGGARWVAHGPYLFKGVEEPIEVFEAGVPGLAPLKAPAGSEKARRGLRPGEEDMLGWRPAPSVAIPGREHWVLAERLGEGGFGEVWLARHAKTKEPRVFKFCFDVERLRGLKREVTLFRLLKETLGDREDIARVIDWSFEAAPFFIESDYTDGGDLLDWAEGQGGLGQVPLAVRLELVAQVAGALGAAHSVGVLHKDIKPSNVLVTARRDGPRARLADFGIGAVLDRSRLESAGLAETNLTAMSIVASAAGASSGTRMYAAPELLEGKPATIQADIYALGVLLYQLVVGDARRALSSDWREEVADELLREDIAWCVAGDPRKRLGNAERLADRLRTLEARRTALAEERRKAAEAEAALASLERSRRRRRFATAAGAVGGIVLVVVSVLLVQAQRARRAAEEQTARALAAEADARSARDRADAARTEAEELVGFMVGDLRAKLIPVGRLDIMDDVLARVDALLEGRRGEGLTTRERDAQVGLLIEIVDVRRAQGRVEEADAAARRALAEAEALASLDPANGKWQQRLGMAWVQIADIRREQGKLEESWAAAEQCLAIMEKLSPSDVATATWANGLAASWIMMGKVMRERGRLPEAREAYGKMRALYEQQVASDPANAESQRGLAVSWNLIGGVLQSEGNLEEANTAFQKCLGVFERLAEADPANAEWQRELGISWNRIGGIHETQGKLDEAQEAFGKAHAIAEKLVASDPTNAGWQNELALSWALLAGIREAQGQLDLAQEASERSHTIYSKLAASDPANPGGQRDLGNSWNWIGDILEAQGKQEEAQEAFGKSLAIFEKLAASDPTNARWQRDLGVSWSRIGGILEAQGKLDEARQAYLSAVKALDAGGGAARYRPKTKVRAARAYLRVGRPEDARGILQGVLELGAAANLPALEAAILTDLCAELGIEVPPAASPDAPASPGNP